MNTKFNIELLEFIQKRERFNWYAVHHKYSRSELFFDELPILMEYIQFLVDSDFIEEIKVTNESLPSYKITSKGEKYLNTHSPNYP